MLKEERTWLTEMGEAEKGEEVHQDRRDSRMCCRGIGDKLQGKLERDKVMVVWRNVISNRARPRSHRGSRVSPFEA